MALINRISRLFRADFHAVLDRLEEPDALLRQAVREMQDAIQNDETRYKQLQLEQTQIITRQSDITQKLQQLASELDICFDAGKDELAHKLIKRKLEAQRIQQFLVHKLTGLQSSLSDLQTRLEESRSRMTAMQQKLELLCEDEITRPQDESWLVPDFSISEDEVEVAFLREKQARTSV